MWASSLFHAGAYTATAVIPGRACLIRLVIKGDRFTEVFHYNHWATVILPDLLLSDKHDAQSVAMANYYDCSVLSSIVVVIVVNIE